MFQILKFTSKEKMVFHPYILENYPGFCDRVRLNFNKPILPDSFPFSCVSAYADCIAVLCLRQMSFQSIPIMPEDHVWCWEVFLDSEMVYASALGKVFLNRIPKRLSENA